MEAWEKNPASKPAYDTSDKNRQLSDTLKILSTRSSDPKRVFDTCAYCHGNKNNVFVGFKGGDRYADYALPFHAPQSEGSRCINCHMSDVNWRQLVRKRDHTFQPPVPENTARFGIPNACTTCHDDRSPEWATRQMNEWWGDADRRGKAVTLADTMYRASSGDVSTLPALARLAVDRSQGLLVRASAAEVLVAFGIVQLPGNAGEALRKAQVEYVLSLDTFPDVASKHAAKGWLEAERGNASEAGTVCRCSGDVEEGPKHRALLPQYRSVNRRSRKTKVAGSRIPDPGSRIPLSRYPVIPSSAERSGPWPALLPPSSDPRRSPFP